MQPQQVLMHRQQPSPALLQQQQQQQQQQHHYAAQLAHAGGLPTAGTPPLPLLQQAAAAQMGGGSEARAMGGVVEGPPTALPSLNPEADQSFNLLGGAFADLDGQVGGPVLSCIATDAQLLVWRVPPLRCCGRLTAQRLSFPGTWGPCTAAHALVPAAGRRRNRLACRWSPVPRPSLPSLAAAALPQIPGSGGDLRKQQILKQQRWLLFLRHCARCQLGEAQCQYGRNCTVAKQLWQHLVHCKEARCDYPR
jgi:hypothetical protein